MRRHTTTTVTLIFLFIFLISIQFLPQTKMSHSVTDHQDNPHNHQIIDPYERLHIIPNSNGTLTRLKQFYPTVPPSNSLSKDIPLNPIHNTWIRIFKPEQDLNPSEKLPIVVFVHGGGFILCSAATPVVHDFCSNAASRLGALVVSVDYRLAPEHRLPAAYDDVLEALRWVKEGKEEWIREYGNLSNCILMGESAGGNIAYHAGLTAAAAQIGGDLKPLIVRGMVLIQPYFGGPHRTESELRLVDDSVLPLVANDLMWDLSLPIGANRSHEYCDPTVGGGSSLLDRVMDLGWKVGVVGSDGDPLFDRDMELVKLLERRGLSVRSMVTNGDQHGVFVSNPTKRRNELFDFVMGFIFS